jgi:hypothetical protein
MKSAYLVGLLFETPPVLDGKKLLERLQRRYPAMTALGELQFSLPPDAPEWQGTTIPGTFVVTPTEGPPDPAKLVQESGQTWDWPEVKSVLARCRYQLAAGDFLGALVAPQVRLSLLHGFLAAVVEEAQPLAIHWLPSERFVDPARYLALVASGNDAAFAGAALNVRMFNVGDGVAGEKLMDTRGLTELGLPDVQCHFSGLPPDRVAVRMAGYAHQLFLRGDYIQDGDTVDGLPDGTRWRCQHEESLAVPARAVVDLGARPASRGEGEVIYDARKQDPFAERDPFAEGFRVQDGLVELEQRREKERRGMAKVILALSLLLAFMLIALRLSH